MAGSADVADDHQDGNTSSDIVGTATNPAFFTTFSDNGSASHTDGTLGFRVRLDAAGGKSGNPALDGMVWVGIDANQNGSVDAFVGVNVQGASTTIEIRDSGSGANTSPSSTALATSTAFSYATTSANYNYRAVNYTTDGGTTNDLSTSSNDDPDYYVSFTIPFANLVSFLNSQGIAITDQTGLRYVVATSSATTSLNQDVAQMTGGLTSTTSWQSLGAFSPTMNAAGQAVPEPAAALLGALGALGLLRRRR
ncbi:hypothetical protein llg_27130 [Luteolibacter sp. LG18]|nr:hypothetical protein llg_27130 [Luteolibacter sp. LG18]